MVIAVLLLLASGATYEAVSRARVAREFPPEGRMIDIGARRIQLDCRGKGSPIVVFESGLDTYGSLSWATVQDSVAKMTRTCSYSRAGVMWSDPGPSPRDGNAIAADLHATLVKAGERPPYVLVGHSLGVPDIMIHTLRHPTEVSGLVFVDGSHPDQIQRFAANMPTPNDAAGPSYFKRKWVGRIGISRLLGFSPPVSAPHSEKEIFAYQSTSSLATSQEEEALGATLAEAGRAKNLGSRPLYVLTSTLAYTAEALAAWGGTAAQGRRQQGIKLQLHNEQTSWSTVSHHELIADSDHYIQIHRPDAVVAGVKWVLDRVGRTDAQAQAELAKSALTDVRRVIGHPTPRRCWQ
ncbi:MAG TPA: alpha/beta hydrolase [Steroidobacteraceae bacterium]|nr:alpha/beta hydrolase [Steroidobacteraceae bacterium]